MKTISAKQLAAELGGKIVSGSPDAVIRNVAESSSGVKRGDVFVCVKGFSADGHDFVSQAAAKGASCLVVSRDIKRNFKGKLCVIKVADTREALFTVTEIFYAEDKKKIRIIGITGTKGKTTISYLVHAMLKEYTGKEMAVIGTVAYRIGNKVYESKNTTPSNLTIHRLIREAVNKKIKYLVIEVSSHALDQDRLRNIKLDTAVITNVTRDHFDYHKTFENYLKAKLKVIGLVRKGGTMVVNLDDPNAQDFINNAKKAGLKVITCSLAKRSDIRANKYDITTAGMKMDLTVMGKKTAVRSLLIGAHNASNILCAIGAVVQYAGMAGIKRALQDFKGVAGRMEVVYNENFTVIVDYAHTHDGLEKILESLNGIKKGRIITVFGAGGNRDRGKRPLMGEVAERLSDEVIVTSDNPRFEKPEEIINDIMSGIKNKSLVKVEPDRRLAVEYAVRNAGLDDIVLIAGKGHEQYQEIKGIKYPFDDRKEAVKIIKKSVRHNRVPLSSMLAKLDGYKIVQGSGEADITGVEDFSAKVRKGSLFICVKGFVHDGHDYLDEAVKKGASAIIIGRDTVVRDKNITVIRVADTKQALYKISDEFYKWTKGMIKLIGITGTNGKTTVLYMIDSILTQETGKPNAIVGTIEYRIGKDVYPSGNTTPSNITLHRLIAEAVKKKIKYFIFEVSSHALDQGRVNGIELDAAAVTNVTRDHFDYHKSFDNYLESKLKIIDYVKKGGVLVVNADDVNSGKFTEAAAAKGIKTVLCSFDRDADIKVKSFSSGLNGTKTVIDIKGKKLGLESRMPGRHNIYNMMFAAAATLRETSAGAIKKGIQKLTRVNGRSEVIYNKNFAVIIDYAHTPDALKKVLSSIAEFRKKRIITVFGAPGNRDKGKRPMMGAVAEKMSDLIVVTSDNTENEQADDIIKDIVAGIKNMKNVTVEPDRKKAIAFAVGSAKKGDIVLIAGKGHETYQDINGKKVPFEDKQVALSLLGVIR
jgi:UDP-N-acetylmuramyl-tripeptide synthetase